MKPKQDHFSISSIKQIKKILSCRNQVLVKVLYKNEESRTPGGIIKIGDIDFQPAAHANRISEVIMVPDKLHFHLVWHKMIRDITESMPWRTDMELQVSDIIWHSYMDSLNCPIIDCDEDNEQYKLLNYYDIYVLKRKKGKMEAIIPLNGYVLCEEVLEKKKGDLDVLEKHIDKRYGRVAFVGKKNYGYRRERIRNTPVELDFDGDMDLEIGDIIIKKNPDIHILLEDQLHAKFNNGKMYFVIQRKDIYAKISDIDIS